MIRKYVVNFQPKSRKDILLEYVQNVQPEFMELFVKRAPQQVLQSGICFFFFFVLIMIVRRNASASVFLMLKCKFMGDSFFSQR